ncbi:hypothetical protein C8R46DRAFT_1218153 [Mycena filopes]|nr:hypothetical protein C8R46DRAFT_1218153 [Mycena filopes]
MYRKPQLVRSREWWAHQRRRNAERAALASIFSDGPAHDGFNGEAIVTFVPGSNTPTHSVRLSTGKILPVEVPGVPGGPSSSSIQRSATAARPTPRPKPNPGPPLNRSGKTWAQEDADILARLRSSAARIQANARAVAFARLRSSAARKEALATTSKRGKKDPEAED